MIDLSALRIFLTVVQERSFSKAAAKVHLTQPAVSQAVRRLEGSVGEVLFDRSSKSATPTEAGLVLVNYGARLLRLMEESESAVRELRDLRRGRVLVGANEGAIHMVLPLVTAFRKRWPDVSVDVRRVPARQVPVEVLQGSLDFGVLTFEPSEAGLRTLAIGTDELVLLVAPSHPLAARGRASVEQVAEWPIVAHNDPSPQRDRVLQLFERRHITLNIRLSLPSIDAIKRAVEMDLGVALLPRRCAIAELADRRLVALHVAGLSRVGRVLLVSREALRSHAADAFLSIAQERARVSKSRAVASTTTTSTTSTASTTSTGAAPRRTRKHTGQPGNGGRVS
jgi:DNA-binding transcriptional LysR family regulator